MKFDAETLQKINDFLAKMPGTVGLIASFVKALANLKKRRADGLPDPSLDEFIKEIEDNADQMVANADQWFKDNPGYDPRTGEKLPEAPPPTDQ